MKKYIFKFLIFFTLVLFFQNSAFAQISFGNVNLNEKDEVLFTVENNSTHINSYSALMTFKIKNGVPEKNPLLLSYYPEQMEMLDSGKYLQVRNSFGNARYNTQTESFTWESKAEGIPENPLPLVPYSVSSDGLWYCYLEKTSFVTADLILVSVKTGKSKVICKNVQMSYEKVPVKWSIQGTTILLYEKEGNVYFCNPEAVLKNIEIDEQYRLIGRGTINSVEFTNSKFLAYVDDYLLYKINTKELYTVGLYSEIIGQGVVVGRLPFKFNPRTDKFSVNKDVSSIVIVQNKTMFSYLSTHKDSSDYMDILYSRPYTDSSASLVDFYIFWDKADNPILWMEKLPYEGNKIRASVFRLSSVAVQVLEIEDSGKPFVSPDGTKVAFYAGAAAYVYNISDWSRLADLNGENIISIIWADSRTIFVGGTKTIKKWNPYTNLSSIIALSSVTAAYWDGKENRILADNGSGNTFELDKEKFVWKKVGLSAKRDVVTQNGRYRIFTGTSANCYFTNAIYIRTLGKNPVTKPVYDVTSKRFENKKSVALIFDAYDNADGLAKILTILKKYKVTGTFFINGEFIRRYPSETKQIVANGYNCNSMFFTQTDLTKNSFVINEDFIRRGLARNEDEFYQVTNNEFSLYWHAPYYQVTEEIKNYAKNAGYNYTDSKLESFDFSTKDSKLLIQEYYDTLEKNQGGIIPVTIGYSQNQSDDYLYNYLDLLIFALFEGNFQIVGVNELQ